MWYLGAKGSKSQMFDDKMTKAGLSESARKAFLNNYEQLTSGVTGLVRVASGFFLILCCVSLMEVSIVDVH